MKTKNISVKVKNDKVILPKDLCFTTGNVSRYSITLTLPEAWKSLIVYMLFDGIKIPVVDGICSIPEFSKTGMLTVGVVGYEMKDDKLVMRFSPEPGKAYVTRGSYSEDAQEQEPPRPDIYEAVLRGAYEAGTTAREAAEAANAVAAKIREQADNGEFNGKDGTLDVEFATDDEVRSMLKDVFKHT